MHACDGSKDIISYYQDFDINHHLALMTVYCQRIYYLNTNHCLPSKQITDEIIHHVILACSERDDHDLLMFQLDRLRSALYDFII